MCLLYLILKHQKISLYSQKQKKYCKKTGGSDSFVPPMTMMFLGYEIYIM